MSPAVCKSEFTTKSANETLPLVKRIVGDIVELAHEVTETQKRLAFLTNGREDDPQDEYSKELQSMHEVTDAKSRQLNGFIDELLELNLDPTSAEQGFVNFPARREGKEICLCWKLGEPEVMYWHDVGEECHQRRLVDLPIIQTALG
ncbi:MAG: DUF2203 domain-containing protein [Planctomycetota bacterium]